MKIPFINIPTIGIILFLGIYTYATQIYQGGHFKDIDAVGFDWVNNYWCDLISEEGRNGAFNPAAFPSKIAMLILTISLMVFFYEFPKHIGNSRFWKKVIPFSGITSMIIAIFIFTKLHDWIIVFSGFFGLIALIGIFVELARSHFRFQLWFGVFGLVLMALNNFLYFVLQYYDYLPLLQKITFVIVLMWIISVAKVFDEDETLNLTY